ncbi:MAG: Glu/Leu/Phe/Val dehydrogenase, partial [bacterium]|nr:Glu/Leu/Phe/Val dehydrogenase [bacterium]
LSIKELERLTRRYTSEISIIIGPEKDIPAPDIGTDSLTMAWVMDTYSMNVGYSCPGVVTGKPLAIGGSLGRRASTARGAIHILEKFLHLKAEELINKRIAIHGYGKVGQTAHEYFEEKGAKVIAIADTSGAIYSEKGFDRILLSETKKLKKGITTTGYNKLSPEDFFSLDCDVLIPASIEAIIDQETAKKLKTKILLEIANAPTTLDAYDVLKSKNIYILPDILCNAGGVIVSYFEWVQDVSQFFWNEDEIYRNLFKIINKTLDEVFKNYDGKNNLREVCWEIASKRLAKAVELRGIYP